MNTLIRVLRSCVDNGVRLAGPLFVLLALALIAAVVHVLFFEIIPYYDSTYLGSAGIFHLSLSFFLLFNIVFNYYMTIFTHPGESPNQITEEKEVETQLAREGEVKKGEGFTRFCKFCKKPKPPRTHHCHICKRCILRMDHHCPWVSNCVGFYNHKYFVLFLLYLWIGCGYVAILSFPPFRSSIGFAGSRGAVLFTFVITLSVMLALSMLLGWHIYLVLTGQTTIEFYYNKNRARHARMKGEMYINEYDLGNGKNFQIFFGPGRFWFSWLLPSVKPPPGDGLIYLTRSEHLRKAGVNHHFV